MKRARLLLLAATLLAPATAARAQHLEGTVGVHRLAYRYKDDVVADRQSGLFLGASGSLLLGSLHLGVNGMTGRLDAGATLPTRELRVTRINLGVYLTRWLELGAEGMARRESDDTTVVLQRLGGIFSRASAVFGTGGLEGMAEFAVYPARSAINADPISLALRAGIGARFAPGGGPVVIQLSYRMFRLDHTTPAGAMRLEQDETLVFELGLRR